MHSSLIEEARMADRSLAYIHEQKQANCEFYVPPISKAELKIDPKLNGTTSTNGYP